ncbi:hypothetical protein SS52_4124 [Escherichia coli O157:H7 str. SS52]|nr:hypothetical protein SS52_4124 [Escherichia coli O157:H7 str. SS52]
MPDAQAYRAYKGNQRLMRRLRVLSDLQPLPHVGWIRRSRRIRQ